jgi:hypothetical protein
MSENLRAYLYPYLVSNGIALLVLVLAFRRPNWARFATIGLFAWAFTVNARIALWHPQDYQGFGELALLPAYRDFIYGWFRDHTAWLLLPIAIGQLAIAILLIPKSTMLRRLGVVGAALFLLAIAPLGVGSAFPFSLTYIAALIVMERRLERAAHRESNADVTFAGHGQPAPALRA